MKLALGKAWWLRPWGAPVAATLLLTLAGCGDGQGLRAVAAEGPGRSVALPDGRQFNLRCAGNGAPTVLLESGFGADSGAWFKVQPTLARKTRVCSYDRAGYGYSDPGPLPRDGAAIARDLDQGLNAAHIKGPFIVVGHSAGGLYARLFAARRSQDIQGLILLDPTVERRAPQPTGDGLDGIRRRLRRCNAAADTSPRPLNDDPAWSGCISPKTKPHGVEVAHRPATWRSQLSELDSIFGSTSEHVARAGRVLGDIPLYVITASDTAAAAPQLPMEPPVSVWQMQHQQLAGSSRRGYQTTVLSSHLVMIDRPDVVIAAVLEMVAAGRAGRPPGPLPSSETESHSDTENPADAFAVPSPFDVPLTAENPDAPN